MMDFRLDGPIGVAGRGGPRGGPDEGAAGLAPVAFSW